MNKWQWSVFITLMTFMLIINTITQFKLSKIVNETSILRSEISNINVKQDSIHTLNKFIEFEFKKLDRKLDSLKLQNFIIDSDHNDEMEKIDNASVRDHMTWFYKTADSAGWKSSELRNKYFEKRHSN